MSNQTRQLTEAEQISSAKTSVRFALQTIAQLSQAAEELQARLDSYTRNIAIGDGYDDRQFCLGLIEQAQRKLDKLRGKQQQSENNQ